MESHTYTFFLLHHQHHHHHRRLWTQAKLSKSRPPGFPDLENRKFATVKLLDGNPGNFCVLHRYFFWNLHSANRIRAYFSNYSSRPIETVFHYEITFSIRTCESEISVRIEARIESGGSRLHVQCRLSCGICI